MLAFDGDAPNAKALAETWHEALEAADAIVDTLPAQRAGTCVLTSRDELASLPSSELVNAIAELRYRSGSIQGALPIVIG